MTIRQKPQMKARADSTTEHLTDLEKKSVERYFWTSLSFVHFLISRL